MAVAATLTACSGLPRRQAAPPVEQPLPAAWSTTLPAAPVAAAASGVPVAPTAAAPAPVSSTTAATADLARWWQRLGDPLLDGLVQQALAANTSVATAQANLRQARAQQTVADAALQPALTGVASSQRTRTSGATTGSHSLDLDASWEVDLFGQRGSAAQAAAQTVLARRASLGDVQVSVSAEVVLDYVTLRNTQARLALAERNLESQSQTLQIARWRQQAGLITALDVQQAEVAVAQLQAQLPVLSNSAAQGRHALAVLTGQTPAALDGLLSTARPLPALPDPPELTLPADTLRQRADVRAAEATLQAAWASVQQADAARWPTLKFSGVLGLQAASLGGLNAGAWLTQALASLTAPLIDGGALAAQAEAQRGSYDAALASYRATVLAALQQVEDVLAAVREDGQRVQHWQTAADRAAAAATLARQRYASGLIDFQTVLETQRSQFSAEDSLATALADRLSDHVRLFKALGGGWTTSATVAATPTAAGQ